MKSTLRKSIQPLQDWPLWNQYGQSTTEYIVVILFLFTAFLGSDTITGELQQTFQNKYKSYAFAVSVSDPPSAAFDQEVHDDANKIKNILSSLKDIVDTVEDLLSGDIQPGTDPGTEILEDFKRIIDNL